MNPMPVKKQARGSAYKTRGHLKERASAWLQAVFDGRLIVSSS
jgi:hypothetical protein